MILRSHFTKRYVYNGLVWKITSFTNFTNFTNFTTFSKHSWRICADLEIIWAGHEVTRAFHFMSSREEPNPRALVRSSAHELTWAAKPGLALLAGRLHQTSARIRQECFEKVVKFVKLIKLIKTRIFVMPNHYIRNVSWIVTSKSLKYTKITQIHAFGMKNLYLWLPNVTIITCGIWNYNCFISK